MTNNFAGPELTSTTNVTTEAISSNTGYFGPAKTELDKLYRPLSSKTHIRLIFLYEGSSSLLRATFNEVDLAEDPQYEPLSYVWGTPRFIDKHILIDQHKVPIRDNLWQALQRVRLHDGSRTLWVDALSICQTDPEEKAQQVALIGYIFRQAQRVLVWAGEHEQHSEQLFAGWADNRRQDMQTQGGKLDTSEPAKQTDRRKSPWYKFSSKRRDSDTKPVATLDSRINSESNLKRTQAKIWEAFIRIEYWTRRWIVQELILTREVVVYFGGSKMDWCALIESRYDHTGAGSHHYGLLDGIAFDATNANPLFFCLVDLLRKKVRAMPLMELMWIFKTAKCATSATGSTPSWP